MSYWSYIIDNHVDELRQIVRDVREEERERLDAPAVQYLAPTQESTVLFEVGNMTSNCAGIWNHALGSRLTNLSGQRCKRLFPVLEAALAKLTSQQFARQTRRKLVESSIRLAPRTQSLICSHILSSSNRLTRLPLGGRTVDTSKLAVRRSFEASRTCTASGAITTARLDTRSCCRTRRSSNDFSGNKRNALYSIGLWHPINANHETEEA